MNAILIIAGKEFRDGLRNRWVLAITLVFAFLAIGLAYFGASASGMVGLTSLSTTIISLASLAIFLNLPVAPLTVINGEISWPCQHHGRIHPAWLWYRSSTYCLVNRRNTGRRTMAGIRPVYTNRHFAGMGIYCHGLCDS